MFAYSPSLNYILFGEVALSVEQIPQVSSKQGYVSSEKLGTVFQVRKVFSHSIISF